jgi:hypothetical protein
MNIKEYWAIIEEWRKLYGTLPSDIRRPADYNPTNVKLGCKKCKKIKTKMQRHHKANDFFFAMALPHIFAARYILFHPDDVDLLCASCHKSWHRYVEPKLVAMYDEYRMNFGDLIAEDKKGWCEYWKIEIVKWYSKWVNKPLKRKKRRKKSKNVSQP